MSVSSDVGESRRGRLGWSRLVGEHGCFGTACCTACKLEVADAVGQDAQRDAVELVGILILPLGQEAGVGVSRTCIAVQDDDGHTRLF